MTMHSTAHPGTGQKFITRPSLATRWDISIDTIRRKERAGELTPRREIGPVVVRYAMEEIIAIEEGRKA